MDTVLIWTLSMEPSVSVLITDFDCAGCFNVVYYFIS